jgi:WD40 repeat protein
MARIWNAATGELVVAPLLHSGTVRDASFSPDSSKLVTACHDRTARVWDAESGQPITPGLKHAHVVITAYFADEQKIRTRTSDNLEHEWELRTSERAVPELTAMAHILSGRRVDEGTFWPLAPSELRSLWDGLRAGGAK